MSLGWLFQQGGGEVAKGKNRVVTPNQDKNRKWQSWTFFHHVLLFSWLLQHWRRNRYHRELLLSVLNGMFVYLEAEAELNHEVMRKGRVEETLAPPSLGWRTMTPLTAMSSVTEPRNDSRSGDSCVRTGMRPRRLRSWLEVETMAAGDRRKRRKMRMPMLARWCSIVFTW